MCSKMSEEDFSFTTHQSPESELKNAPSVASAAGGAAELSAQYRDSRERPRSSNEIDIDATQAGRERDAPGQSCIYIPPGDHREEFYRLATFGKFPVAVPVRVTELASVGFYYTGFKDRVKCFSCGMAVENWIVNDDGMDPKWHRTDCPLMLGDDSQNFAQATPNFHTLFRMFRGLKMPLYNAGTGTASGNLEAFGNSRNPPMDVTDRMSRVRVSEPTYPKLTFGNILSQAHEDYLKQINLRSEAERRKTFAKWPSYPAPYLVSEMAKDGFFYLGNLDRAQCFSCSGVLRNWAPHDNVREQHGKHFSNCLIVRNMDTGNIPMTDAERQRADQEYQEKIDRINSSHGEPANPPAEEQRHLAQRFPCRNPVNPHMLSLQRRIETFDQRWPKTRIRASVEQIAKAGFFYLGDGDKTKCFYCNGGLQNWDPNDEPWTEHAKWFPGCEFILRQKGVHFVRALVEAHPNLNRPYIRNPVSYNDVPPIDLPRTSPPQSMETETHPRTSINISEVERMGFQRSMIDRFIQAKDRYGGYNSTEELIQDLLENRDVTPAEVHQTTGQVRVPAVPANAGNKREGQPEEGTSIKKTRTSSPTSSVQGSEIADSLRELEEEGKCRKCRSNKTEVCLIPCGHLCLCEKCAPSVKRCLICNSKIQSTMRVFRA